MSSLLRTTKGQIGVAVAAVALVARRRLVPA